MAAEGERRRCVVRAATPEEIDAWARAARPGDRFVYFTGPALVQGPAAARARDLYHAGLVDFGFERRCDCDGFDYYMRRRAAGGARPEAGDEPEGEADPAMDTILRALRRAANFGRRCPSDLELAREAGLATRAQAAWRVRKLREAGLIRTQAVTGDPEISRVVTIVRTGRSTAMPTSWAAARRSLTGEART